MNGEIRWLKQAFCVAIILIAVTNNAYSKEKEGGKDAYNMQKVEVERLPDLKTPRVGHAAFYINGELFVAGGHTTGFKPTSTAEFFTNGKWHNLMMSYCHDDGLYVELYSGKLLLAGGHKDNFGIGQTFEAELYNPSNHSFGDYGCLDTKRALAVGTEIDSGKVVISGNWYAPDNIEVYDGKKTFTKVKDVSVERTVPYILRTSGNDVIIFGSYGIHGEILGDSSAIVDRLVGETFNVPLLKKWKPLSITIPTNRNNDCLIGDLSIGNYSYLLLAKDTITQGYLPEQRGESIGEMAIIMVCDTIFNLLPTECPIPKQTKIGGLIYWYSNILADRNAMRAYLAGVDKDKRLYILSIDYTQTPAPLKLYYTEPLYECGFNSPILTEDGNIAIIGGNFKDGFLSENYTPTASVFIVKLNPDKKTSNEASTYKWGWICIALALIAAITLWLLHRNNCIGHSKSKTTASGPSKSKRDPNLFQKLCELMEQQKIFRNNELKVADAAKALLTNNRYILDCIKENRNQTFSQFVNGYRIEYAKQQLLDNPNKTIVDIYLEAGFSSERSFYRSFKDITGMTTREWINEQKNNY